MSKIFLEILDDERKSVFSQLAIYKNDGYLAGGTGLALQLGHRISFDFDVFTHKPIGTRFRSSIEKHFSIREVHVNSSDQYTFTTTGNIEVTFVWLESPLIRPLMTTSSLSLASMQDIAANKANTLGLRAAWRDYVDLYWIMHDQEAPIQDVIAWANQKYPREFVEAQFLEQLVYFNDLTVTPIQFIDKGPSTQEIQTFLKKTVSEYLEIRKQQIHS
ncbi:nucleotidyl transferase AbiEii/AbiGii toxin family protein [Candidatus Gottesmanbacteria bacterium]|nr:nucleotidyl transferase AbiEii/AbiGii toxin family protein [Candidatus Gottesmanbacteria bacterium]